VQHRQVAGRLEANTAAEVPRLCPERDHQPQCGTAARYSLAHRSDPQAGDTRHSSHSRPTSSAFRAVGRSDQNHTATVITWRNAAC
jgi:hypothetical protein